MRRSSNLTFNLISYIPIYSTLSYPTPISLIHSPLSYPTPSRPYPTPPHLTPILSHPISSLSYPNPSHPYPTHSFHTPILPTPISSIYSPLSYPTLSRPYLIPPLSHPFTHPYPTPPLSYPYPIQPHITPILPYPISPLPYPTPISPIPKPISTRCFSPHSQPQTPLVTDLLCTELCENVEMTPDDDFCSSVDEYRRLRQPAARCDLLDPDYGYDTPLYRVYHPHEFADSAYSPAERDNLKRYLADKAREQHAEEQRLALVDEDEEISEHSEDDDGHSIFDLTTLC